MYLNVCGYESARVTIFDWYLTVTNEMTLIVPSIRIFVMFFKVRCQSVLLSWSYRPNKQIKEEQDGTRIALDK